MVLDDRMVGCFPLLSPVRKGPSVEHSPALVVMVTALQHTLMSDGLKGACRGSSTRKYCFSSEKENMFLCLKQNERKKKRISSK